MYLASLVCLGLAVLVYVQAQLPVNVFPINANAFISRNNYHGYVFVPGSWTFEEALDEATSQEYAIAGVTGHLATIISDVDYELLVEYFVGRTDQLYFATKDISSTAVPKYTWLAGPQAGQLANAGQRFGPVYYEPNGDAKCVTINFKLPQDPVDSFTQVPCGQSFGLLVEIECPGGFTLTPNGCLESGFYNADRTHYYDYSLDYLSWGDSIARANAYTFKCRKGHLATITSPDEMTLIKANGDIPRGHVWIAGNHIVHNEQTQALNDDSAADFWLWGDGPEKGQPVRWVDYNGNTIGSGWKAGEPNSNAPGDAVVKDGVVQGRGCMKLYSTGFADSGCSFLRSMLVEYECPEGFYFGEQCCEVINQCSINNGGCGSNSQCLKNAQGPYFCRCAPGYVSASSPRDGKNCVEIDLCNRPSPYAHHNPCGQNSTCSVNDGKIGCACNSGYFSHNGDGTYCLPSPLCADNNGGCGSNSLCTNPTPAVAVCSCNTGYKSINVPENGRDCAPIDTCNVHPNICGANSVCTNSAIAGEYKCACIDGFVAPAGDGKRCVRITTPDVDPAPEPSTTGPSIDPCNGYNQASCGCQCGWCKEDNECYTTSDSTVAAAFTRAPFTCKTNAASFKVGPC